MTPTPPSHLGALISQAALATADAAMERTRQDRELQAASFYNQSLRLFKAVRRMDVAAANQVWTRLGDQGPKALMESHRVSDQFEDVFTTWWRGAKAGDDWGIEPEKVVEMALWLDEVGACPLGPKEAARGVEELALRGAARRRCRQEIIRHWAFHCENGNYGTESIPSLLAIGNRWLADPDEAARAHPQDWLDAAFIDLKGQERQSPYLKLAAKMWPSFGFEPTAEHWRSIAQGWGAAIDHAPSGIAPVAQLLRMGQGPLEPEVARRLAWTATRFDGPRVLQELGKRCPDFPLEYSISASEKTFHRLFQPIETPGGRPLLAPPLGRAPEPCPLLAVAAWQELDQPSQDQANPRLPYCFEALAKVPAMVEASLREFGRPEWLVPINHRLLPQIHERFPQWFRADESGDNAMHLMARLIPSVPWESVLEGPIRTIASCANEELRALLGQSNAQGKTPLDELRERIQHCGGPTSPRAHALLQELESLADAVEIRSAAAVSVRRALAVRV